MAKIKTLVQGLDYIAQFIDAGTQGIEFSVADKSINTDSTGKLFWGTDEIQTIPYSLPIATATTLGGVTVPSTSLISVSGAGAIDVKSIPWNRLDDTTIPDFADEVHTHTVSDITDFPTGLEFFDNSVTEFQNETQVDNKIATAVAMLKPYVKTVFVSDGTDGYTLGDFVAIGHDDSVLVTFNTIADVDLSIRTGLELDPSGTDPSIDPDGIYLVVNFGTPTQTQTNLSDIIPTFNGYDGAHIQTTVNAGVIAAILKAGTVGKDRLTTALAAEIDHKIDKKHDGTNPTVVPGNLAEFTSAGDITDSGKSIEDFADAIHTHEIADINGLGTTLTQIDGDLTSLDTRVTTLENAIPDVEQSDVELDVPTSNISVLDKEPVSPATTLTDTVQDWFQGILNAVKWLKNAFSTHTHDGVNSLAVDYQDLVNKPTQHMDDAEIQVLPGDDSYSFFSPAADVYGVNIEYVVTRGADEQYGTIMLRKNKRYFIEKDVFGDEVGVIFGADATVGSISIENTGATSIDVKFLITYL